jgi:hypothetical protein
MTSRPAILQPLGARLTLGFPTKVPAALHIFERRAVKAILSQI